MGKLLLVQGADFSTNGMPIVQPVDPNLAAIKNAIENSYNVHLRFSSAYGEITPSTSANNRNAFGCFDASNFVPFIITPKAGCKIAPLQWVGQQSRWDVFEWTTEPVSFYDFSTFIYVGANLAYTTDADIPLNTSVWDFIGVSLVE